MKKKILIAVTAVVLCAALVTGGVFGVLGISLNKRLALSNELTGLSGAYKNVILLIGDGMGKNHMKAGEAVYGKDFEMRTRAVLAGEAMTFSRALTGPTDSAASATALSTGVKVDNGEVAFGVLPVENSSAGSVSAVYDLILKHRFYIVKALDLPIDYCLAGLKQSAFEDIEIVWSHPQSLSQCAQYIADHGFDSVPCSNTSIAARDVAKEKRLNVAAICSYKACEEYGLKVLDNHLQDNDENTTRFIVISKKLYIPEDANRISLCFSLPHVTGSLYSLLCRFNSLGLNLTKIESRPRQGRQFEYLFYLDFSGNVRSENVIELVSQLSEEMPEFSFLGNYAEPEFPIK